ncbi:HAD family hydrolase [Pontibacillus marinus]|uniref:Haloacid dehalogenase n=1 Tax=Pontibacillus marinus BH030004 = DSM 16465 TaxID=1385511 RepID=A0A0A5GIH2_9BACI|nr:HAD-IA family hydrolase [Pontibacillus marinus]KGX90993.1 haloacid dehalogenase [Pontibacillus marinus BH030004 = DSM 16465]
MVKAIIFDLDDTLISEKKYIESGYMHISHLLSNRLDEDQHKLNRILNELFQKSPQNVFNRLLDIMGVHYTKSDILELVEEYRNHFPDIEFFDDVSRCLEFLREKNIKIGIITDGYSNSQRQKLNAVKAFDIFDEIIITSELGKDYWKPHPKSFEIMKEKLNVEFNEMIYVGDNPEKDFYIYKIYPINTVRVLREGIYKDRKYLDGIKEKYSIENLKGILDII